MIPACQWTIADIDAHTVAIFDADQFITVVPKRSLRAWLVTQMNAHQDAKVEELRARAARLERAHLYLRTRLYRFSTRKS